MNDAPRVRYFVTDCESGLTIHNFFDKQDALEASVRMKGTYHIGKEFVDDNGTPLPFKEEEYYG